MNAALPIVFAFVLGLAFLLLLVTFRSIVVPLKAIVLNLLSRRRRLRHPHLRLPGRPLREPARTSTPSAGSRRWLPLFLFVILFGLSMDYHVFIISRIREAVDGGMTTDEAVAHGIKATAGVVTSAAVVMVAVFAIFATPEHDRVQADGRRPRRGDPARRDARARGPAPGDDEAARRAQLVPPAPAALVAEVGTRARHRSADRMPNLLAPMRIGVLTGGGDCPGLNAVIRAIVRKGIDAHGHEFVGLPLRLGRRPEQRDDAAHPRPARAASCTAAGRSSGRPARTCTRSRTA